MTFGLVMLNAEGPARAQRRRRGSRSEERAQGPEQGARSEHLKGERKRLIYDRWGRTNNTCIRVDNKDYLFGHPKQLKKFGKLIQKLEPEVGRWVKRKDTKLGKDSTGRERNAVASVWLIEQDRESRQPLKIEVTQLVEIIPGTQSRRLDTCLVRYTLENQDTQPHEVGIRFLLDTFIGANDGVPFLIPGNSSLCDTMRRFSRANDVPEYIQALEHNDLLNPGTVAHIQFHLGGKIQPPTSVLLGGYPDFDLLEVGYSNTHGWLTDWEVPLPPMTLPLKKGPVPDSAVTMYWDVKQLQPGEKREVGFSYGLGQIASEKGKGRLLLTVPTTMVKGKEFTLTALVKDPRPNEKLTLAVNTKMGFHIIGGKPEKLVPAVTKRSKRNISSVSWRVRADKEGKFRVGVSSNKGITQNELVRVLREPYKGILD